MVKSVPLRVTRIACKNFRCFQDMALDFEAPYVLIEGCNGSGKTSLLEALYYSCYLRSFRTHSPRDLVRLGQQGFFIKTHIETETNNLSLGHDIQIGFSGGKRLVKIDNTLVSSHKTLLERLRVLSLTEDDLALVQEGPDVRRAFIDQSLMLIDPNYAHPLRMLRQLVDTRNAALERGVSRETMDVVTHQLWEQSRVIQKTRIESLAQLQESVNTLIAQFDPTISIEMQYQPRNMVPADHSFDDFAAKARTFEADEQRMRRSLFGAHLDDFQILFQHEGSRRFASRGQQKMIVVLFKIAQALSLSSRELPAVFLIDDYMTDFDERRSAQLFSLLTGLTSQLIFTSPVHGQLMGGALRGISDIQSVKLTD